MLRKIEPKGEYQMIKNRISKVLFLLYGIIGLSIFFLTNVEVQAEEVWSKEKNLVNLYFFHSDTCSHCIEEEKILQKLENNYSNLKIYRYEIHEEGTQEILKTATDIYEVKSYGTPLTIIGEEVYLGYMKEKSDLQFVQTIEYYSRYAYQDKLGEQIGITDLPFKKSEKNAQTLKEFQQEYGNYTLLGKIETKDLDTSLIATITGILSGLNPIFLFSVVIVFFLLKKWIGGIKNQTLLLIAYFLIHFFLSSTTILKNGFYALAIQVFLLVLFTYGLVKYYKNKKRQYVMLNGFIVLAVIVYSLSQNFYDHYLEIFLEVQKIYLLEGIECLTYYANYLISVLLVQFMVLISFIVFINKIMQKYSEKRG